MSAQLSYKTLRAENSAEFVINKSRFIGYGCPCETEEEALAFLARIRQKHKDATHNCYAYIIGLNSGIMRYSDDGEPGGTAGMPIIEVMKARGVVNCAVVVTRYFGGILLGAGGLVRAYAQGSKAALDAAGIRARYIRIQASPEEFGEVVRLLRERGFTGANVTVPHKQAACSLCNDTDALSRVTGSVNTLVFQKDGSVSGFNTDGPGFARAIREEFSVDLRDLKVALLGSCGGAGLALAYTCAMQRCERLTLAGRSEEKLQELKNRLSSFFIDEHRLEGASDRLAAHQNNTPRFNAAVEDADLIVNATSLGLKPTDPSPVPPALLSAHHLVYDLQTHDDAFQMEARFQGARVSNGLSMLVHQGALSFERWFGVKPDISAMRRALEQKHD